MMRWLAGALIACAAIVTVPVSLACGVDEPCTVESGEYRIRMPAERMEDAPLGAVMYFHGWKGTAERVMRNAALAQVADDLGVALIAPHGAGGTWSYPGSPGQHRDEFRYVEEVLDDAVARFGVDSERVLAAGFSMGGSMVWNLACHMGERFAGFAPIAGAFWEPLPARCPSGMPIMQHVHGMGDRVVPYEGRPIGSDFHQGDVGRSIDVWLAQGTCAGNGPTRDVIGEAIGDALADPKKALSCEFSFECGRGVIELCLHRGGHSVRPAWIRRAWLSIPKLNQANAVGF